MLNRDIVVVFFAIVGIGVLPKETMNGMFACPIPSKCNLHSQKGIADAEEIFFGFETKNPNWIEKLLSQLFHVEM